ncbi:MAG TPA: winged helix-turn-helix domain-containing protein [Gammaproteobacteria bacterium]|nr:winged helix-turn-helix domain-containing protein [Gammaproteobacteria bacterium]
MATGTQAGTPAVYRFADLMLRIGQHRLERDGQPIELGRLSYALLVALVESAPNVLTHDDLVRAVWGGRATTPETVTQRVKLLRDALGDDAQRPHYVGLVRGGGYRLIPSVERLEEPSASVPRDGRAASADVPAPDSTAPTDRAAARPPKIALAGVSAGLLVSLMVVAYLLLLRYPGGSPDPAAGSTPLGLEITQLTSSGRAFTPAISPDGKFVVYVQAGENGTPGGLWVRQIGTTREVLVVAAEPTSWAFAPTVSPDGRFIDYVKLVFGKGTELWRVSFLGGTPRLLRPAASSPIGWSPDGKHGAFVAYDEGTNTSLVEVDDRFEERVLGTRTVPDYFVATNIVGGPPTRPAYSPDGRFIAIPVQRDVFAPRIAVIETATREEKTYDSQGSFVPQGVGWLGPSTLVVSQPAAFGQRVQLFKMSYPGGGMAPLTNDLASYIGVDLDASRTRLVTTRRDVRASIWLGDASGETAVQLVPPTPFGTANQFLAWAGERVLYDSTFGGHAATAAIGLTGGTPEEVVRDAFHVAAAPDGSAIVFGRSTRGSEGLWRVDASGLRPKQLVSGFAVEPVVTAGRAVVFVSNRSGVQSPWRVPLDGGEPTEIVRQHANAIDVSPDGRLLAFFTWRGTDSIVVCELPDCSNPRELPYPPNIGATPLRWTPDGKQLAYIAEPRDNIWAVPLDGGPPHALTHFAMNPSPIVRFAWSRDGRLAFVRASTEENVVLVSGLRP